MFVARPAISDDAPTLLKLAKMVHFVNLPADPEIIREKIVRSCRTFAGEQLHPPDRLFMFVLEDTDTGNVVGTSSLIPCVSSPDKPLTFLRVRRRELYSNDLHTGQVHLTLQLGTDESGPSEVGGLVLGPSYRKHKQKLGMLLSLIRFHFIGRHREWFADRIVAEMMGPLTLDSRNLFWEHVGRRFINLSFAEADLFCQRSVEFITALFPKEEIFVSLLPAEARHMIGKVGVETESAKKLLESVGFKASDRIDPFDGGPYLEADTDDISLVKTTTLGTLTQSATSYPNEGFISVQRDNDFRALRTPYADSPLSIPPEAAETLRADVGDEVAVTPLPTDRSKPTVAADPKQASTMPA